MHNSRFNIQLELALGLLWHSLQLPDGFLLQQKEEVVIVVKEFQLQGLHQVPVAAVVVVKELQLQGLHDVPVAESFSFSSSSAGFSSFLFLIGFFAS